MGKISFKLECQLHLKMICVPHARLCKFDHVYVNVEMFGQTQRTRMLHARFPIPASDHFFFEKVLWSPQTKRDAFKLLKESPVSIELRHLMAESKDSILLAYTDTNAYEFLIHGSEEERDCLSIERNVELTQTEHHCGPSPKVKFSIRTTMTSSVTPVIDEYLDHFSNNCIGCEILKSKRCHTKRGGNSIVPHGDMYSCNCELHKDNNEDINHCTICHQDKTITICQQCHDKIKKISEKKSVERIIDFEDNKLELSVEKFRPPFVVRKVSRDIVARKPDAYDSHYNYIVRELAQLKSSREKSCKKLRSHSPTRAKSMQNLTKTHQTCYACLLPVEEVRISCDACNLTARGERSNRNCDTVRPEPPLLRTYRETVDQRPIFGPQKTKCSKCMKRVGNNAKHSQDDSLLTSSRPLYLLDGYRDMAKYFPR